MQKKMIVFKNENEAKQSLDMNIFKAIWNPKEKKFYDRKKCNLISICR
jgi:hypothetical protein